MRVDRAAKLAPNSAMTGHAPSKRKEKFFEKRNGFMEVLTPELSRAAKRRRLGRIVSAHLLALESPIVDALKDIV